MGQVIGILQAHVHIICYQWQASGHSIQTRDYEHESTTTVTNKCDISLLHWTSVTKKTCDNWKYLQQVTCFAFSRPETGISDNSWQSNDPATPGLQPQFVSRSIPAWVCWKAPHSKKNTRDCRMRARNTLTMGVLTTGGCAPTNQKELKHIKWEMDLLWWIKIYDDLLI